MKINLTQEMNKGSLIGGIVLHNVTYVFSEEFDAGTFTDENRNEDGDTIIDLKLTMNGIDLDLTSYFKRWEDMVEESIKNHAKHMVLNNLSDVDDIINELIDDVRNKIAPIINERIDSLDTTPKSNKILRGLIPKPISVKSDRLLESFDKAAEKWGWEQDQGSGPEVNIATSEYIKAKQDLINHIYDLENK